jgi:segregation and condensation protein A
MSALAVRDLELDLDAFEGPFDLLLTLVLKEELELLDVQVAEIVASFVERWAHAREERGGLAPGSTELAVCGEFLVLVAALLELKARDLLAEDTDVDLEELDPDEAAAELAERLAAYRRIKEGAAWLERRLDAESDRFFRIGPAPLAALPPRPLPRREPAQLAAAIRALAAEPPAPSLTHLALRLPPLSQFLGRFRAVLRRRRSFVFDEEVDGLSRIEQAVAFLALLELRKAGEIRLAQPVPLDPITVWNASSTL